MPKKSHADTVAVLRAYWKPKGKVNKKSHAALDLWLKENVGAVDIATFIHSSKYEKRHTAAVRKLVK